MTEHLKQPGFRERLSQLGYLLKHTFTLIGRDPGIVRPWIRMALYGLVMSNLFFFGILAIALDSGGTGTYLILAAVLMFLYKFFYYTRQEMRQSWLVSEALQGRQRTAEEAGARISSLKPMARSIAWLDMLVAWLINMARRSNKAGAAVRIFMKGVEEVWDLLNHYLLPSAAVDGYGVRDGVSRMKTLQDNVPETLAGVFGIDIASRAVGAVMGPVYFIFVLLALGLGLWVGESIPAFHAGDIRTMLNNVDADFLPATMHFSWLPLFIAIWLGKLGSVVLERMTTSVKVIYFSIFYMRITHTDDIMPEIRQELDGYLRMEDPEPSPVTGNGETAVE
ncbi:MAG: hypothetical protein ACQETO_01455 [Pseudomonadota bacterium]